MKVRLLFSDSARYLYKLIRGEGVKTQFCGYILNLKYLIFFVVGNPHQRIFSHRFLERVEGKEREKH